MLHFGQGDHANHCVCTPSIIIAVLVWLFVFHVAA